MNRVEVGLLLVAVGLLAVFLAAPSLADTSSDATAEDAAGFDLDRDAEPPTVPEEATATVDGERYDSAAAAIEAADPGDTVVLEGTFEEHLVVDTPNVTVTAGDAGAAVDGSGTGDVLTVRGDDVTVEGLWVRNSGFEAGREDAGVFVAGNRTTFSDLYLTDVTYGVWVDGADEVTITDNRIEGRPNVTPPTDRGNGIHLWETADTVVSDNEITGVRDGIYYSWAEGVVAEDNEMWGNRYGVHYMYSDDNRLADNLAVDNDVGYALMVSERLEIVDNVAVRNDGTSGHGILVKDIEDSTIRGNHLVDNDNGLYVYNAQRNEFVENLLLGNDVGIHDSAASSSLAIEGNSFVDNEQAALTTANRLVTWNGSERGNYWADARTVDRNNDGRSEVRYRPAGIVEHTIAEHPTAAVFAESPAFDAVRLAESSFPVVETPGIVDRQPLVEPQHDYEDYQDHANQG